MQYVIPCLIASFLVGVIAYGLGLNRGYRDAKRGEVYKDTDDSEM